MVGSNTILHIIEILGAFACAHHFWPKGITYGEAEEWEKDHKERQEKRSSRSSKDRRSRGDRGGDLRRSRRGDERHYHEYEVRLLGGKLREDTCSVFAVFDTTDPLSGVAVVLKVLLVTPPPFPLSTEDGGTDAAEDVEEVASAVAEVVVELWVVVFAAVEECEITLLIIVGLITVTLVDVVDDMVDSTVSQSAPTIPPFITLPSNVLAFTDTSSHAEVTLLACAFKPVTHSAVHPDWKSDTSQDGISLSYSNWQVKGINIEVICWKLARDTALAEGSASIIDRMKKVATSWQLNWGSPNITRDVARGDTDSRVPTILENRVENLATRKHVSESKGVVCRTKVCAFRRLRYWLNNQLSSSNPARTLFQLQKNASSRPPMYFDQLENLSKLEISLIANFEVKTSNRNLISDFRFASS
ncbi:hypothetical protein G7Y89_g6298 [Cudoniella acicularis]|uniref:Uncharacterized protein n=1 Tax=Cudoniella acicularis TaxID=354080 RepID=A0A8H4RKR3_9HELO|nr:hypothetical protein G7Y89_g6298 [Cudoniella acicularis]